MRVVGPSISAPTRFSAMGHYESKSCMNPSVSRIRHDCRLSRWITTILGLVQGAELVTARATAMVRGALRHRTQKSIVQSQPEKLRGSKFDNDEDLEAFSQKFDEGVKQSFSVSNSRTNQFVKFGSPRDNDPSRGINRGKLTLTG